jgi:kinesin family protein 11
MRCPPEADIPRQIEQAMKNVSASTESIIRETNTYVQAERQLASDARSAVEDAVAAEVVHLQAQNAHLTRLLEAERLEGARDREALMQTIGAAIGEYAATRERRMRGALGEVERANGAAEAALGKLGAGHGQMMDDALERGKQLGFVLDKKGSELKRTRDGATKVPSFLCRIACQLLTLSIGPHVVWRGCQRRSGEHAVAPPDLDLDVRRGGAGAC